MTMFLKYLLMFVIIVLFTGAFLLAVRLFLKLMSFLKKD